MDVDDGELDATEADIGEDEVNDIEDTAFEAMLAKEETGLEPERKMKLAAPIDPPSEEPTLLNPMDSSHAQRLRGGAEGPLQNHPYIVKFSGKSGAVYEQGAEDANNQYLDTVGDKKNLYAPFSSKLEWEIVRWAKLRGLSSTAFAKLMAIEGVNSLLTLFEQIKRLTNDL